MILDILKKINFLLKLTVGRKVIILSLLLLSIIVIFELAGLAAFLPLLSVLVNAQNHDILERNFIIFFFKGLTSKVEIGLFFLVAVFLIKNLATYVATKIIHKIQIKFLNNLSGKIIKLYLNQDYVFFLENNSSKLVNVCSHHAKAIKNIVDSLMHLFIEVLINITIFITLLFFLGKLAILVISFFLLFTFFYIFFIKKMFLSLGKEQQVRQFKIAKILTEIFNSVKELYVYNKRHIFIKIFNSNIEKLNRNELNQSNFNFLPKLWIELLIVLGFSFIIYFYYISYDNLLGLSHLLGVFAIATLRFVPGTNKIIMLYQKIIITRDSLNLVYSDFNNLKSEKNSEIDKSRSDIVFKEVFFDNISFKYNSSKDYVLKKINLKIAQGDLIGIFGKSGSGKTTLIDILLGLLKPNEGNIIINNINSYKTQSFWSGCVGYIPQNPHLFDNSVLNNITFFEDEEKIDLTRLEKVLNISQLNSFVENLPQGIKTIIGEKGARISGGQKQRIIIARVLYQNPQILIFDEATNALDSKTEYEILNSVTELNTNYKMTIIFITHKLDLLKNFKHIYKVENSSLIKYN
jgi:ABC-type multidrug transport system fused ATPase/permease subunit